MHSLPIMPDPVHLLVAQVLLPRARIGRSRHNVEDVVSCVPREAVAFQGRPSDR